MGLTAIQESKTLVFKEQKPHRAREKRGNTQVLSSPEIRRNEPNQGKTTEIRRLTRSIQSTIPMYCLEYIRSCTPGDRWNFWSSMLCRTLSWPGQCIYNPVDKLRAIVCVEGLVLCRYNVHSEVVYFTVLFSLVNFCQHPWLLRVIFASYFFAVGTYQDVEWK